MSSADIMSQFREIQAAVRSGGPGACAESLARAHSHLRERYPYLFQKVCTDPGMDLSQLQYMLDVRDMMDANRIDGKEASEQVGKAMFATYVKPMLDAKDGERAAGDHKRRRTG